MSTGQPMDPGFARFLEGQFAEANGGVFMARDGAAPRTLTPSQKKLCFVATDKAFLVSLLYELSLRPDCWWVKYSVKPRDGMYLGRCFMTSDEVAGRLCQEYKAHPKLMVAIQDDDFFERFRAK